MKIPTKILVGILTVAASAAAGIGISTAALAGSEPPIAEPKISVNEAGETYGSGLGASKDPDLILAYGVDGTIGYVRAFDLNGPDFTSPEEALAYQEKNRTFEARTIPLYASDGSTIIGEFEVSGTKPE